MLTQARLDMLALNQNRNASLGLEGHVQELNDHYHLISHNLDHLKQSTTQEVEGLRSELGDRWSLQVFGCIVHFVKVNCKLDKIATCNVETSDMLSGRLFF